MAQLDDIILAFRKCGGSAPYAALYDAYEKITGRTLTPGVKAGIRKCIEDHSSDSANYKGKENLFYSVEGKGKGVWGLR